jgi:hypothetical protein
MSLPRKYCTFVITSEAPVLPGQALRRHGRGSMARAAYSSFYIPFGFFIVSREG